MGHETDVVIVGGGPGGAASAMWLAEQGIRSTIVEMDPFPRFHIGESMTGECGGLVRKLGFTSQMTERGHAVKHGVTVYGTGGKNTFWVPVMRRTETDELEAFSTWQVRRSEFDSMMLDEAIRRGADLIQAKADTPALGDDGSIGGVRVVDHNGSTYDIKSKVVIDATGRKTWLANNGVTGPKTRDKYDSQIAIFSHVKGALRDPDEASGNTLIIYQKFLHWSWFIPLDSEVTSVGIVVPSTYFRSKGEKVEDFYRRELRELNPELSRRLQDCEIIEDVRAATNYSYVVEQFTGPGFVSVGDSHRFIDPIFSFGLYLTLYDARDAAASIARHLDGKSAPGPNPFLDFQRTSNRGWEVLQDLIDGFWGNPLAFGYMTHFTSHRSEIIDMFAGRVFGEDMSAAQVALKKVIATSPMWARTETGVAAANVVEGRPEDPELEGMLAGVTRG